MQNDITVRIQGHHHYPHGSPVPILQVDFLLSLDRAVIPNRSPDDVTPITALNRLPAPIQLQVNEGVAIRERLHNLIAPRLLYGDRIVSWEHELATEVWACLPVGGSRSG